MSEAGQVCVVSSQELFGGSSGPCVWPREAGVTRRVGCVCESLETG